MWCSLLALALLVPGSAAAGGAKPWQRAPVAEHPVTVEVPEIVRCEHDTSDWGIGRAESDSCRAETDGSRLSATVTIAPLYALKIAGNGLVFTTTRSTVLDRARGKQVSWTDIQRDGLAGKRLVYEVGTGDERRRGTMEVFVKDQYIVTLDALVPSHAAEVAERFLSSARLFAKR